MALTCAHTHADPRAGTLPQRLRHVADTHLDYRRRAALRLLIAFILTLALIRLLTFAIHNNLGPFHDITLGKGKDTLHIHHYMWGLALIAVSGFLLVILEAPRWHPWLAIPFGIGVALVVDEFALLLQLQDVYWSEKGAASVELGLALAALLILYYVAQCYWHDVGRELGKGFGYVRAAEHHVTEHHHHASEPS